MKKILTVILALFVLASCSKNQCQVCNIIVKDNIQPMRFKCSSQNPNAPTDYTETSNILLTICDENELESLKSTANEKEFYICVGGTAKEITTVTCEFLD